MCAPSLATGCSASLPCLSAPVAAVRRPPGRDRPRAVDLRLPQGLVRCPGGHRSSGQPVESRSARRQRTLRQVTAGGCCRSRPVARTGRPPEEFPPTPCAGSAAGPASATISRCWACSDRLVRSARRRSLRCSRSLLRWWARWPHRPSFGKRVGTEGTPDRPARHRRRLPGRGGPAPAAPAGEGSPGFRTRSRTGRAGSWSCCRLSPRQGKERHQGSSRYVRPAGRLGQRPGDDAPGVRPVPWLPPVLDGGPPCPCSLGGGCLPSLGLASPGCRAWQ
jgi:hypothetical protein